MTIPIQPSGGDFLFAAADSPAIDTEGLGGGPTAGAATHYVFGTPASVMATVGFLFTITAKDINNLTATSYSGTAEFGTTGSGGIVPPNTALVAGQLVASATLTTEGTQAISAYDTVTSSIHGTSSNITVAAGPPAIFVLVTPVNITSGVGFTFTVTVQDAQANTVTAYNGTVAFATSDPYPTVTLPPNSVLTNGVGVFSATLYTVGNQTLTATDAAASTLTGYSSSIAVNASTFLSDNMVDTAGTPLASHAGQIGTPWLSLGGTDSQDIQITNANRCTSTTAGATGSFYQATGQPATANYRMTADFYCATDISGYAGLFARSPGTGNQPGYWVIYNHSDAAFEVFNNSVTRIATTPATPSSNTTYNWEFEVIGPRIRAFGGGGIPAYSFTDTSLTAKGVAGITIYGAFTNTTGFHLTNVVGTNLYISAMVVCDGASNTQGYLLTTPLLQAWPIVMEQNLGGIVTLNFGVGGETVATMTTNAPTNIDPFFSTTLWKTNISIVFGGDNDIYFNADADDTASTTISRLITYCQARQAAGWFVIPTTLLPRGDFPGTSTLPSPQATHYETRRLAFNTYLRNNWRSFANALSDPASDTNIGQTGDNTNSTYYQSDNTHLKPAGHIILASYMEAAVSSLLNASVAVQFAITSSGSDTAGNGVVFTVTAQNAALQTDFQYTGTVKFTCNDAQATLPGNATLVKGVGVFTATLKTAGTISITATDTVNSSLTGSGNVTVSPASASAYQWVTPATLPTGTNVAAATMNIIDAYNNVVTSYSGSATISAGPDTAVSGVQIAQPAHTLQTLPNDQTITGGQMILNIQSMQMGIFQMTATDDASVLATANSSDINFN